MNELITMKVRKDGWVTGKVGLYQFQAVVFGEGSIYGINNGRVSKLFIQKQEQPVVVYDRKWEKNPTEKTDQACYLQLLSSLEQLPA